MNPNWTGKSARTLGECRFWDADPIERHSNTGYGAAWWVCIGIVAVLAAAVIF